MKPKSKDRIKKNGEVFTPPKLVNEMLDKLGLYSEMECWKKDKDFLDPACGDGNFLVEILKRKIVYGHKPSEALSTVFGVDIMKDNIKECRKRLLEIVKKHETITINHIRTATNNIVCADFLKLGGELWDDHGKLKKKLNV